MPDRHLTGRAVPGSTYRLQLQPEFGFADAADLAGYLARLGITHAYLSPILQAAPGSRHGYDVVDHSRISAELGGEDGFRYLAARLAAHGIGLVVDLVPNHMAVPAPEYLNRQLWSVLSGGQDSPHAHWFDIDWAAQDGRFLLPILPRPLRYCEDDLSVVRLADVPGAVAITEDDAPVLRYQDHVLPLRPGTEKLPVADLLAAQHYRLDSWRSAATDLNWRRFFDITSLIAVRVEEPDVFAATHGLLLGLVAEGLIDGLRIDHPDGLADPRGYLRQLATAASGSWIVAEKILASDEVLPADWPCAGTTGYDALAAVTSLFTDPAGVAPLTATYLTFAGEEPAFAGEPLSPATEPRASAARSRPFAGSPASAGSPAFAAPDWTATAWAARRETAGQALSAEVRRLARLVARPESPVLTGVPAEDVRVILAELLAAFTVYRAYVVPGQPPPPASVARVSAAAAQARRRLPGRLHAAADLIAALLLGRSVEAGLRDVRDELIVRFQQTCAAVQAKGVEDTAAYRYTRLISANEVGADPDQPGQDSAHFHAIASRLSDDWPTTMTTLSTHDTKRQEDVRARLAVLAEEPLSWATEVSAWHARALEVAAGRPPAAPTEYLLWQTLVGAWPIDDDRLIEYLRKAMREAKQPTSWTEPDSRYEAAAIDFVRRAVADAAIADRVAAFVRSIEPAASANSLGTKLVQLTMPGVPDVYQGCELTGRALVDPDNRRPVDFASRQVMLAAMDDQEPGARQLAGLDTAKLLVTSRALRLRRDQPDWFAGDYRPLSGTGAGAAHLVAFCRGDRAVTVATRLPASLRRAGGWGDTALPLPAGGWIDVLTGTEHRSGVRERPHTGAGRLLLADLTARLPVALLVPAGDATGPRKASAA